VGLWFEQRLGGKEGATASEAGTETAGLRREAVAEAVAVSAPRLVQHLPGATTTAASAPKLLGPITLGRQPAGKRRAGKPHAAFDVAGAGNVARVALCTHPAIERAGLETLHLQQARLPSTLPVGGLVE
jgi:predicted RNase H-like nuclease